MYAGYKQPGNLNGNGAAWSPQHFAHGGVGAYMLGSAALAAALESAYSTDVSPYIGVMWQADLSLGDAATLRAITGLNRATKEVVIFNGRDFTTGTKYRSGGFTAAGAALTGYLASNTGPVCIDGTMHLIQHVDESSAAGVNGRANCRVDAGSNVAMNGGTYVRANLGPIGRVSLMGEDRNTGVVPTLGRCVGAVVATGITVTEGATIAAAQVAAYAGRRRNAHRAYLAWLAACQAAGTVEYAEAYCAGSGGAAVGDTATQVAVTFQRIAA